jgi:hypothetical protein
MNVSLSLQPTGKIKTRLSYKFWLIYSYIKNKNYENIYRIL